MNATATRRLVVEPHGTGVVGHVGLHALGSLADRLELGSTLSATIAPRGERPPLHDRGKVLVQTALMLAGGGSSCSDIEHLRVQADLFGSVPSDSTVFRTFHELGESERSALAPALRQVRSDVWERLGLTRSTEPVILDIDASLIEIHSENKEHSAPHFKGGFGFHPMFCFADATGEALSSMFRPGNAAANTASDHVALLDAAIDQLDDEISVGHRPGDESSTATRQVIVRADSAGNTNGFLTACRERNVRFFVTARSNAQITAAVHDAVGVEDVWLPSVTSDGELRPGACVTELTSLVDLSHLPSGTRLIVRREPLHPGAQRSLFPSLEFRYWGFLTDADGDPVELDLIMRSHAHVESHIQRLKDSGLTSMPFTSLQANATWMMVVALAGDLVRWFQLLCLQGPWREARPKRLRFELFGAPGRLIRSGRRTIIRIIHGWPGTEVLLGAYRSIARLT